MANLYHYNTITIVLIALAPYVYSLKCWNCNSISDPKCADPFENSTMFIMDCKQETGLSPRPSMCQKIRQKVKGEWHYFRDCSYLGEVGIQGDEKFCVTTTGPDNISKEYCMCNSKDGCNSSTLSTPRPLLILLSLVRSF